jgi:hypothetical protein
MTWIVTYRKSTMRSHQEVNYSNLAHRIIIPWNINSFIFRIKNSFNYDRGKSLFEPLQCEWWDTNRKLMLIDKLTMNNDIKLGNFLNVQVDIWSNFVGDNLPWPNLTTTTLDRSGQISPKNCNSSSCISRSPSEGKGTSSVHLTKKGAMHVRYRTGNIKISFHFRVILIWRTAAIFKPNRDWSYRTDWYIGHIVWVSGFRDVINLRPRGWKNLSEEGW